LQYGPTYYGAFLIDPDGNSVEAVHGDRENPVPVGCIDHLKRAFATLSASALLAVGAAAPAVAQPQVQDGLVNVAVGDISLLNNANIGVAAQVAANVCGVKAARWPSLQRRWTRAAPWPPSARPLRVR
jgi:hypothetical protein